MVEVIDQILIIENIQLNGKFKTFNVRKNINDLNSIHFLHFYPDLRRLDLNEADHIITCIRSAQKIHTWGQ